MYIVIVVVFVIIYYYVVDFRNFDEGSLCSTKPVLQIVGQSTQ